MVDLGIDGGGTVYLTAYSRRPATIWKSAPWKQVLTAKLPSNLGKLLENEIGMEADAVDLR